MDAVLMGADPGDGIRNTVSENHVAVIRQLKSVAITTWRLSVGMRTNTGWSEMKCS